MVRGRNARRPDSDQSPEFRLSLPQRRLLGTSSIAPSFRRVTRGALSPPAERHKHVVQFGKRSARHEILHRASTVVSGLQPYAERRPARSRASSHASTSDRLQPTERTPSLRGRGKGEIAHTTDRLPTGDPALNINPRLGLAGETGYLLTVLKKEVREDAPTADATVADVRDELGDVIWYATCIAKRDNINFLEDVMYNNIVRIQTHYTNDNPVPAPLFTDLLAPGGDIAKALERGPECVSTFDKYQALAIKASRYARNRTALAPYLVQIWQNVGDLLKPFGIGNAAEVDPKNRKIETARSLGDIMWYVAGFAELYGLSLDAIVEDNKKKILSAFPSDSYKGRTPLYDEGLCFLEQFPRRFDVDFVNQDKKTTVMLINDVRVGDPLTDNAYEEESGETKPESIEGYRYHDAVHLAFAAILVSRFQSSHSYD